MPTISEIRQKYPQYNDISDQQLADSFHDKYYSDVPKEEFYKKIGYSSEQKPQRQMAQHLFSPEGYIPTSVAQQPIMQAERDVLLGAMIPGGGSALSRILANTGTSAGISALQEGNGSIPEKAEQGGLIGAGISAIGESLPAGAKAIGKLAEVINPKKYTKDLIESIQKTGEQALEKSKEYYNPVQQRFGNSKIFAEKFPNKYTEKANKEFIDKHYDSELEQLHNEFIEKPTFQNAHDLQSKLGYEIGQMSGSRDVSTRKTVKALRSARDTLKDQMDNYLKGKGDEYSGLYKKASDIYRQEYVPFISNPTISKILSGEVEDLKPKQLETALKKVTQKVIPGTKEKVVHDDHFLRKSLGELSKKRNVGKVADTIGSTLSGVGLGASIGGPIGAVAGGAISKAMSPAVISLAQNPTIIKMAQQSKPFAEALSRILSATAAQQGS